MSWKKLRVRAWVHRGAWAFAVVNVVARLDPDFYPRVPLFALLSLLCWTTWRLRVAVCPACDQHVLREFSRVDSMLGVVPGHCTACGAEVGTTTLPEPIKAMSDNPLELRSAKLDRWAGRCLGVLMAAVALYAIEVSGRVIELPGILTDSTAAELPYDTEIGRQQLSVGTSSVHTDVGTFDWDGGKRGPVIVRARIGRLSGRLYPESAEPAPSAPVVDYSKYDLSD